MPVFSFPENYDDAECVLVPINVALIPLVAGALRQYEERRNWPNDEQHERAYNAFAELEAIMTALCVRELVESNNRLYRLLDSAFNGVVYNTAGTDPITGEILIEPPIPTVPTGFYSLPGATRRLERLDNLLDNFANGTTNIDAGDNRNIRDMLQELIDKAVATGELDPEILAELVKVVALLGV